MNKVKKLSLVQLIGITMAFFGTVRSVPTLAINGWTEITYFIAAVVIFAIPIALIAAELATGWPKEGGPQVWVKEALGPKWGFVTSWLLWVQMMTGMVMVGTTIGVLLGYVVNDYSLSQNNIFVLICVLVSFWGVTLLNLKFDMVKVVGNFGALIGVYIPFAALVILGIAYAYKFGLNPHGYLGAFQAHKLVPNFHKLGTLTYFSGIIFIFAGVEISSVHANNIDNPKKNYPIAVIASVLILVALNLIAGLTVSNAIPNGQIQLANITQPFVIYCKGLGIPIIFNNIISLMILIGVLAQMSAWVLGPSKAMIKVAEEGNLPRIFQKRTKRDIPITFLMIQAIVVSILILAYVAIPNVNSAFFMITITTTILYCVVYILICISAIKLRYSRPEIERPFRLGAKNNGIMWIVAILALFGVSLTILVSLIPPSIFKPSQYTFYIGFQVIATIVSIVIPLIIYKCRKPSWRKKDI
ncbi:tyrosine-tyramine antiporter [Clostridium thermobutyricum]|uniref:Glutamate/gamma-aminobutyrate antiporter n=1 Tax=Clostridium thermobutyricum DSM 4928 TaxID=1121339 RepID=A0A1V4SWR0_9CLOT|nr:tyrosine-tyramine antiporter [Clostridium thermobutyricum]OPX48877.1 glutamate/gamma-aminobutyrate antiporter [Clostridium thermobutyricum DSM 4928]